MTLRRAFLTYLAAAAAALFLSAGAARTAEEPEPGAGKAPAAEPAKPAGEQTANGLQVSLLMKDRSFTFGENTVTRKVMVLELKNVGDKPLALGFQLSGGGLGGFGGFGGGLPADSPVKLSAKDAAGKEVPRDTGRGGRGDQPKPEDRPAVITVLKPGKTLDLEVGGALRYPAEGKYSVWAELDEKEREEVLPGVKTWTGKLKSNVLEYDYKGRGGFGGNRPGGGNRGNRGNRGGGDAGGGGGQAPAPPAEGGKEAF